MLKEKAKEFKANVPAPHRGEWSAENFFDCAGEGPGRYAKISGFGETMTCIQYLLSSLVLLHCTDVVLRDNQKSHFAGKRAKKKSSTTLFLFLQSPLRNTFPYSIILFVAFEH